MADLFAKATTPASTTFSGKAPVPILSRINSGGVSQSTPASFPQSPITGNRGILGNILPIGGAVAGGIVGEALDPFGGGIPGALFGMGLAGAGGAAGEAAQQVTERANGARTSMNTNQIVENGVLSSLGQGAGELLSPIAKTGLKAVAFLGNIEPEVMNLAFKDPSLLVPGYKGASEFLSNMIKTAGDRLGVYSDALNTKYKSLLAPIENIPPKGGQDAVNGLISDVHKLLTDRNITQSTGFSSAGGLRMVTGLSFENPSLPSAIIQPSERKAIQTGYDLITSLKDNPTVGKANAVIRTLGDLRDFEQGGGGGAANEILGRMYHAVDTFIQTDMPELAQARAEIKPAQQLLSNVRAIIPQKAGANMSAAEIDTAKQKLLSLYDASFGERRKAVEQFSDETGQNIMNDIAGAKLAGADLSGLAKIPPSTISGVISKFIRLIPSGIAQSPVALEPVYSLIQKMVDSKAGDAAIKTTLQNYFQSQQTKD